MSGRCVWVCPCIENTFRILHFFVVFKQEQKEKKESQAVRKRKKGGANATPPSASSSQQLQPLIHSDPTSTIMNFANKSAESASSSQGEDEGSMEVDPVISVQQTNHSQLAVNSSV